MNAYKKTTVLQTVIIVILFFISVIQFKQCQRSDAEIDRLQNNIGALNDTIRTYELHNGELMHEKWSLELRRDELESMLGVSQKEARELEKKLGAALKSIALLKSQVRVDTLHMHDTVTVHNDTLDAGFNYCDQWLSLAGDTRCFNNECSTTISGLSLDMPLKVGYTANNRVFVTTSCPYVFFTDIDAAEIPAKKESKRRWSLSLQFGVGGTIGYGLLMPMNGVNSTGMFTGVGAYVGIGASYRIF